MKENEEINKVIAKIILSTKRKSRQYSLIEIAEDIKTLKEAFGSLNEVSKIIGISSGMLNQFLSVFKLPKFVQKYVSERKIDSVAIVHYLSKFNPDDLEILSELILTDKLSSQDLRILIPYRKQYPLEKIIDLVERIKSSRDIKVSVIRIDIEDTSKSIEELKSLFSSYVGPENLNTIEFNGNYIDIKFSKQGEKSIRKYAKENRKSLQEFITLLIN